MNGKVPHIVQYQGSKRLLAPQILQYMPKRFNRLVEPFSGMAAITMASAREHRAQEYWINDINQPIVNVLKMAIDDPEELIKRYSAVWDGQFSFPDGHIAHFYHIRDKFNNGEQAPENMLYLLARCVKGAVRYGSGGNFNQSLDKRRHGTNPKTLVENVRVISAMLNGHAQFSSMDYRETFEAVRKGDLVYMDPPYQGVSNARDNRYCSGVAFEEFAESIEILNRKGVDYVISYDGVCGGREYGSDLPASLRCKKVMLNAGISTQATLLGKRHTTFEALYLSERLANGMESLPKQLSFAGMAI
jgi:DNA adenine methylase